MSTDSVILKPQTMTLKGRLLRALGLLLILSLGGGAFTVNHWLGVGLLLLALLVFILLSFQKYQGRNLYLLLYAHLAVLSLVSSAAYPLLVTRPQIRQLAQSNAMANIFLGTYEATFAISISIGVVVALLLVAVPFLLVVAATALIIFKWHQDENISFFEAFSYVLRSVLGIGLFLIVVEDGEKKVSSQKTGGRLAEAAPTPPERSGVGARPATQPRIIEKIQIKGSEEDMRWLEIFGGPGWLIVHPGQVVALHFRGKITRVVEAGSVMLEREEKIRAVLPLYNQTAIQTVGNVLTQDRIPLEIIVAHSAQIETPAETKKRLKETVE